MHYIHIFTFFNVLVMILGIINNLALNRTLFENYIKLI